MRKLLLSAVCAASFGFLSTAQTVLFQDDFESGGSNWNFNGSGDNAWTINNAYVGWSPFIVDTPNQPGGTNTNYMHIVNGTVCSSLSVCNANFDTGSASLQNADLASGLDASAATSVTLEFWYLCAGSAGTSYGTVHVSVDGGATWTNVATYSGVSTWTQETLSLTSVAAGQSNVLVRFQWQNGGAGNDPAFSVDDIVISAMMGGGSNTISTTNNVSPSSWCEGSTESVTVNFTATGTYTAGNVFTAEISDAAGSFASPTAIGSLSSTSTGSQSISCTVPGSLPAGSGYRIRVLSTNPSVTGSDNGSDLTINVVPTVTLTSLTQSCVYDAAYALSGGSPAGGVYSGPGVTSNTFDPASAGLGTHTITYTYTDGNGCSSSDQQALVVDACATIEENESKEIAIYPNPTSSVLHISGGSAFDGILILDLSGRKVISMKKQASGTYDISDIPTGVYMLKLVGADSDKTYRIIKK